MQLVVAETTMTLEVDDVVSRSHQSTFTIEPRLLLPALQNIAAKRLLPPKVAATKACRSVPTCARRAPPQKWPTRLNPPTQVHVDSRAPPHPANPF